MTTLVDAAFVPAPTSLPRSEAPVSETVELVRQAQEGSAQAFALLYDRYVDCVHAYVMHRVGHRQTAEDLVSDVFLRALRRISTFKWQGIDFGAWLITIARNRITDHFKSARVRLDVTVQEVFDTPVSGHADDPEQAALSADLTQHVHAALGQLNGEQAEVLQLRFLHHCNVSETARVMGKSEGAVKALQYRALKSLSKVLPEAVAA